MESLEPLEITVKIEPDEINDDEFIASTENRINVKEVDTSDHEHKMSSNSKEMCVEVDIKQEIDEESGGENEHSSDNWLDTSLEQCNSSTEAQYARIQNEIGNLVYPFYNHWVEQLSTSTRRKRPKSDSKKVHKCPIEGCGAIFKRPGILKHHMDLHANVRKFACTEPNCNKAYASGSHLKRHMKCAHNADYIYNKPVKMHGCPHCIRTYSSIHSLKRHVTIIHVIKAELTCDTCRKTFQTRNQLMAHMYQHTGVKAFKCDHCPEDFVTHYERKRHMRFHKDYKCADCDEVFNHWFKFTEHRRMCTARLTKGPQEFICDCCNTKHPSRMHILKHLRMTRQAADNADVFMCPYPDCNKYYSTNNNMKQHIRVKHQKCLYDCHLCDAKLTTKGTLKKHIYKMHTRSEEERKKAPPKTLATGRKPRKDKGVMKIQYSERLAGLHRSQLMENNQQSEIFNVEPREISNEEARQINDEEISEDIRNRIEEYLVGLPDSLSSSIVDRMCTD